MDSSNPLRVRTERLLAGDRLTAPTRAALQARLDRRFGEPKLLNAAQMDTLRAASARLIPAPQYAEAIDLPGAFDAALSEGDGDGWRYASVQPDRVLQPMGLDALEAAAQRRFDTRFDALGAERQDELLTAAADGRLDSGVVDFDCALWFEEMLTLLAELHFSHPLVQVAIGYDGMADAGGWQDVGLAQVSEAANGAI